LHASPLRQNEIVGRDSAAYAYVRTAVDRDFHGLVVALGCLSEKQMWKRKGARFEGLAGAEQEERLILRQRALSEISPMSALGLLFSLVYEAAWASMRVSPSVPTMSFIETPSLSYKLRLALRVPSQDF
jgi:hypothetical protein